MWPGTIPVLIFPDFSSRCLVLSRNDAVGQASRLSLTLNHRLEAVLLKRVGSHQKMKGNF
jgi:UDP:flavonoid glycosyltransferase YjiC (YdhE family)